MSAASILGVHLMNAEGQVVRVGTLTRDAHGATAFVPDEAYLRDDARPLLSLAWYVPGDPIRSRARLADRQDKIGLYGHLPPWFQGLLPEGALRELVDTEMGPGDHDHFDVLMRLGADLPGGVLIVPETEPPATIGPIRWGQVGGFRAPLPQGAVKFSLAGVQLKFDVQAEGDRLTTPARSGEGRLILKLSSERYPGLPEAEYSAMQLASAIGVRIAPCRLVPAETIDGIPQAFLRSPFALAVDRFDRNAEGGRVHMEDAAQILSAWGDQKYTKANTETVLNMIRRFSTDWRDDILEGFRRIVADVLIGNGDNHLKNWSFIFPKRGEVRLSPAYDIVPTVLFQPRDELALRFAGRSKRFESIDMHRFRRVADFLHLEAKQVEREVSRAVATALSEWPAMIEAMPLDSGGRALLLTRLNTLPLVAEVRG